MMTAQHYRLTQTVLMTALGLLMTCKLWTGNVFCYLNERFLPLIVFGAAAARALALGAAWRCRPIPLISAVNVEVVEQPEHPYMYP